MRVVIILPTFNEKENIEKIIPIIQEEVFPKIKGHEMFILVADDNSPDGTAEVVRKFSQKYKNVEISSGPKHGLGAAYIRGMTYAIDKMNADILFEMDADLQHDHKKIPEFLKRIDEGYDMAVGNRYSDGGSIPENWPIQRKAFSRVANLIIRTIFMRFYIHDWTGGFRALRKEVFLKEKEELTNFKGYTFQVSFLHKAVRDGFKVAEVPFHFSDRTLGNSKIAPTEYIIDLLKYVITARIKEVLLGKFGKFLVVGGFGFIINSIVLRLLVEVGQWHPAMANLVGAAIAIFSNYNLNNIWTFSESRATTFRIYLVKLVGFYASSATGVIFIQTGTIFLGTQLFGNEYYLIYFLVGTFFLLIWNFTLYNRVIWKKKKS